ncbi:hypothetical protein RFI_37253, partial [Reticulomyxa filosa]
MLFNSLKNIECSYFNFFKLQTSHYFSLIKQKHFRFLFNKKGNYPQTQMGPLYEPQHKFKSYEIFFVSFFFSNTINLRQHTPSPSLSSPLIIYNSFLFDQISQKRIVLSHDPGHITVELPILFFITNGEYPTDNICFVCLLNTQICLPDRISHKRTLKSSDTDNI